MLSQEQLSNHTLWLETRFSAYPKGKRLVKISADLSGANLRGVNLSGAIGQPEVTETHTGVAKGGNAGSR